MRITRSAIQAILPPAGGYTLHWDDELKGFGIRVTANGARSFFVEHRIKRRNKRHTLGRWPALNPDQARKQAQAWLGAIASGRDPVAERERERLISVTVREAFASYVQLKRRSKDGLPLKERTIREMLSMLDSAFADWRSKPLTGITRSMVESKYRQLANRSVVRAGMAMRYLRAVFNFEIERSVDAEGRPLIADNPVRVLKHQWRAVRRRKRSIARRDLPAWVGAIQALGEVPDRAPGAGKQKPRLRHGDVFRDYFLFLALTGARPDEPLRLRLADVDLTARTVVFRDTKNRTDHELPLTDRLHDMLKQRLAIAHDFVFSNRHDGRRLSNCRYATKRVREQCGVAFSPQDLRRLAATAMEHEGVPRYTLKAVLNHAISDSDDVTAGYVQVSSAMKLLALQRIEKYVFSKPAELLSLSAAA